MSKYLEKDLKVVIPARLGSKRVKMKNLRKLNGKPLIEYIIETLKKTKYLNQSIYINSDSEIFADIAQEQGIQFYKRPAELATSESLIDEYIYDFIENQGPKYLAVVNPTSPFIDAKQLDQAWVYFQDNDFDTLLSCEKIQTHCFLEGKPINFSINGKHPRSQDLSPVRALNFAITIWDCEKYLENYREFGHGVYTGKLGFFDVEGLGASIDVDYEEDFKRAEIIGQILEENLDSRPPTYHWSAQKLIDEGVETEN